MCHMTFMLPVSLFHSSLKFPSKLPNPINEIRLSPKSHQMSLKPTTSTTRMSNAAITACLLFAFILASFCYTLIAYCIGSLARSWALFYLLAVVVVVLVAVAAARMAMVAWITVLVLLTFVGNRRRVLVRGGRRITADVGSYLVRLLISERKGAFTFACAAVVSLLAMAGLVESVAPSQRW